MLLWPRGGSPMCAAVLQHTQPKKKTLCFQSYIKKIKNVKISNPFCSIVDKNHKNTLKTTTDYAVHFNDVATQLAALLILQLSLQIKNKKKKLLNLGNFECVLSKEVCAAFLAAQTFSFAATVISC